MFLSIIWAISIHTVTAFLYRSGRTAILEHCLAAARFLASAFVSGPAFLVVTNDHSPLHRRVPIPHEPIRTLVAIIRVAILINLLMMASELFTEFYTGTAHSMHATHLYFGLARPRCARAVDLDCHRPESDRRGHHSAPRGDAHLPFLTVACGGLCRHSEKGMGLIIPGFVPSTLDQMVEYQPSLIEWRSPPASGRSD